MQLWQAIWEQVEGGPIKPAPGNAGRRALANNTSTPLPIVCKKKKGQDQSLWATANLAECSP